jgi:hypothetical protein
MDLQDEWKVVRIVSIDELSLLSEWARGRWVEHPSCHCHCHPRRDYAWSSECRVDFPTAEPSSQVDVDASVDDEERATWNVVI